MKERITLLDLEKVSLIVCMNFSFLISSGSFRIEFNISISKYFISIIKNSKY